jgi:hypothetical protein
MLRVEIFAETSPYMLGWKINDWLERYPQYVIKEVAYATDDVHWSALILYEESNKCSK